MLISVLQKREGDLRGLPRIASIVVLLTLFAVASTAPLASAQLATSGVTLSANAGDQSSPSSPPVASGSIPSPVQRINQHLRDAWRAAGLVPSPKVRDLIWCRRIYLDVLGRIPTVAELNEFGRLRGADKYRRLVDRLLGDEYVDDYARNWAGIWVNILIGRTGGTNRDSLASRSGMRSYLQRCFADNQPYDQIVAELVTAEGSCRPGDDDFNGAANFLADKLGDRGIQATAKTAEIFLGTAVQCTQCHNHPFNEYKQNQFWELNAFFRQTRAQRIRDEDRRGRAMARIVDVDFAGEGGDAESAEIYYELRNGKLKVAYPVFLDGASLADKYADRGEDFGNRGYLADINRRHELAELIVGSERLPRALVNRLWTHFLGYGFTKPFYDMRPDNPPSHPQLLDGLANDFRQSGFNFKSLIRWIVLCDAYRLRAKAGRSNQSDDPALGQPPQFSRFYIRQMQAEQLYESLMVATAVDSALPSSQRDTYKQRWLRQLSVAFGTDENDESTSFNGTIPQALLLMNGDLVRRASSLKEKTFLSGVARNTSLSAAEKVRQLYLAALSRRPTRSEMSLAAKYLARRQGDLPSALQDLWWALLNSNEFILIH